MRFAMPAFIKNQPVRAFALLCVAVTTAYVMYMGYWLVKILSSPDWCNRSLKANQIDKASDFDALQACVGLLGDQLDALAWNSHIYALVIAMCLLALMVIVVAGGHLSLSASKTGLNANMGGDPVKDAPAVKAAEEVASAATAAAGQVKAEVAAAAADPPLPDYAR